MNSAQRENAILQVLLKIKYEKEVFSKDMEKYWFSVGLSSSKFFLFCKIVTKENIIEKSIIDMGGRSKLRVLKWKSEIHPNLMTARKITNLISQYQTKYLENYKKKLGEKDIPKEEVKVDIQEIKPKTVMTFNDMVKQINSIKETFESQNGMVVNISIEIKHNVTI